MAVQDVVKQLLVGLSGVVAGHLIGGEGKAAAFDGAAFQVHKVKAHACAVQGEDRDLVGIPIQTKGYGPATRQGGLLGARLIDQAALGQLIHQHRYAGGAQVHDANELCAGFALAAAHKVKDALDVGFLDMLLIAVVARTNCVQWQKLHDGSLPSKEGGHKPATGLRRGIWLH